MALAHWAGALAHCAKSTGALGAGRRPGALGHRSWRTGLRPCRASLLAVGHGALALEFAGVVHLAVRCHIRLCALALACLRTDTRIRRPNRNGEFLRAHSAVGSAHWASAPQARKICWRTPPLRCLRTELGSGALGKDRSALRADVIWRTSRGVPVYVRSRPWLVQFTELKWA